MNGQSIAAHTRGALRSFTVWFAGILMVLPDVMTVVQQNFATLAPFIPNALQSRVLNVIALAILLLRIRTTTSLAQKAIKPNPDTHDDGTAGEST